MSYIYKITNNVNGKFYIGKTEYDDPYKRYTEHIRESKKNRSKESKRAIYRAIRKYGIDNFSFDILEESYGLDNCEREKYYIKLYDTYRNGYNETLGGDGRCCLELNDVEVCSYYRKYNMLNITAKHFNCDVTTIRKLLVRNGIHILAPSELNYKLLSKKVAKIDPKTNKVIQIYNSIGDARREYNSHISDVCNGKRKMCAGYIWKYV